MAALGTLAAGLARLNNPAAAVNAAKCRSCTAGLQRMNLVAGRRQIDEEHTEQWLKVRERL